MYLIEVRTLVEIRYGSPIYEWREQGVEFPTREQADRYADQLREIGGREARVTEYV